MSRRSGPRGARGPHVGIGPVPARAARGVLPESLRTGRMAWPLGLVAAGLGLGVAFLLVQWLAPGMGWPLPLARPALRRR